MNARFLEKLVSYREEHRSEWCKCILAKKIENQFSIIGKRKIGLLYVQELSRADTIQSLLLVEARAAKNYWRLWSGKVSKNIRWHGRKPHEQDPANQLLDIGYHYLMNTINKICEEIDIPTELGIFHKAQSKNARPFVYDFAEWVRPCIVERTLLSFLRKKKKPVTKIEDKTIRHFIFRLKGALAAKYYHRRLKYCITFAYWVRLILLDFMKSVNSNTAYRPLFPSLRHETRCKMPLRKTRAASKNSSNLNS